MLLVVKVICQVREHFLLNILLPSRFLVLPCLRVGVGGDNH